MGKKIIVAGAGHGGIPAAARLAKAGFDVTVYERGSKGKLGYDWTDIFGPNSLAIAGMEMPPKDKFEYKTDMTFYSTNFKTALRQNVPEEELEIKMERRDIYNHIISHAENNGVKFVYNCNVLGPIMAGDRVVGIKTAKGDIYGDMVIDAAGLDSPIRSQLPKVCGIQNNPRRFELFYVYRAFYNKAIEGEVKDKYKVCLLPEGKLGIGWVATEEEFTDLLIGRFDPFDMEEVERTAEYFRADNPSLGTKKVRGGQFVKIPVRQPLSVMVCDGYAAIGDSAFMTVPVIGSGIANSFKASKLLAETIIADREEVYSAETLWDYQVKYYKELGSGLAPLACVKLILTRITPDQLDYIFENHIITAQDLTIGANSTNLASFIDITPADLVRRAKYVIKDKVLLKQIMKVGKDLVLTIANTASMPKKWSKDAVMKWANRYDSVFISK